MLRDILSGGANWARVRDSTLARITAESMVCMALDVGLRGAVTSMCDCNKALEEDSPE